MRWENDGGSNIVSSLEPLGYLSRLMCVSTCVLRPERKVHMLRVATRLTDKELCRSRKEKTYNQLLI